MGSYEFQDNYGKVLLEDSEGDIWVTAQSIYELIGYKNGTKEVHKHVSPKNIRMLEIPKEMRGRNGRPTRLFINQAGVSELLMKASKMCNVQKIQKWFFEVALPKSMRELQLQSLTKNRNLVTLDESYNRALHLLWEGQQMMLQQNNEILKYVRNLASAVKINGLNWREAARFIVTANSKKNGADYSAIYHEIYAELERAMGVKLSIRRKNIQKKTGKKNIALLDVVAADKKLIPTFISILRMYALSHGIHVEINNPTPNAPITTSKKGVA